jgi:hypothetical protein
MMNKNEIEYIKKMRNFCSYFPSYAAILILALQERVNTRFTPTKARKPALDVGANLCVRPKILQYFFILQTIWPK